MQLPTPMEVSVTVRAKVRIARLLAGWGACLLILSSLAAQERLPAQPQPAGVETELLVRAEQLSEVFRSAASRLKPSVVTITSSVEVAHRTGRDGTGSDVLDIPPGLEQLLPDELREQILRSRKPRSPAEEPPQRVTEKVQTGIGSGVIVSPDGFILTNNHVVAEADELQIELSDGRIFSAAVIGSDKASDVAVLKIEAEGLVAAQLGDSTAMQVGDWVLAIGSPFGLDQTVTAGIISATNRQTGIIPGGYEDFLQTDAAINPGNSGGPLVSLRGEVIGVNTAINSRSGTNAGVGFAIPTNMARRIMDDLRRDGRVVRGWLGASLDDVTMSNAAKLKLPAGVLRGAVITSVREGEPAATAGLQPQDVVVAINDTPITSFAQLRNMVALSRPNSQLTFDVFRQGKTQRVLVTVGELTSEKMAAMVDRTEVPVLGIVVQRLTPSLAEELEVDPDTAGVVVSEIQPNARALQLQIRPGDIILRVDNVDVALPTELVNALGDARQFTMLIQRGNRLLQLQANSRN